MDGELKTALKAEMEAAWERPGVNNAVFKARWRTRSRDKPMAELERPLVAVPQSARHEREWRKRQVVNRPRLRRG